MDFSGLKQASTGLLAAIKAGSRLGKRQSKSHEGAGGHAAGETASSKPVASLAGLTEIISGYLTEKEVAKVREAYRFADQAHLGQFRASGAPYISHPIAVTEICAGWKLDAEALMAALLHDVIEDQGVAKQELAERFSPDVAELVDGLSKLDRLEFASKAQQQAESFRKMLLAMARDVRVILVKLADRLHNMRTLDAVSPEKRRRIASETLEIYAPIANRLGLNALFRELQDLCFEAIHPNRYRVLRRAVLAARGNRREVLGKIHDAVAAALPAAGIEADISSREKSLYGIYQKMVSQKKSFSDVLDIYGFRIIVHTVPECYLALGTLHQLYRPVPGKFKDYIAIPKLNGYQSLHTMLVGPYGTPVEFQFRTRDMHHIAEEGVASHWLYKEDDVPLNELQKRTHQWLQSLLDIQSQTGDSGEFLEHVKVDLFPDAVYVFTPRGRIISLPRGAKPVDFAYAIHTDIGHHAVAARINGEFMPLDSELSSGDTVEIITAPSARPSAQWLNYVRTGRARSEIRHYLRNVQYEESVAFGERLLQQAMQGIKADLPDASDPAWDKLVRVSGARNREEILADIGLGKRLAAVVARRFMPGSDLVATTAAAVDEIVSARSAPIPIQGNEGQAVQLASCCHPLPGDPIIAELRAGHGLVVHVADCPVAKRGQVREPERWVSVAWDEKTAKHFSTRLDVTARNERGTLGRIAAEVTAAEANIIHVTMHDDAVATVSLQLTLQVESRVQLARVIRAVRHVPQVQKIVRVKG
ncbi:guanosine-3',5'-bis(diphosphate) 3'-pyrophosphohydrolase [Bordetella sp. J329]|jgi:RelA/SpoT family (p)ppGpp synthetase|uniref:RelA/SpoT family protein n=1 Tax=Kerstersia gyiorum TaxID=206506 RepID=UPI000FDB7C24|nr:bifunctional (p)ppGpp synthetase/guanosine-3',5'-bis(diphosphate) 3'-pyrophosphohydrolase [Kerstersia gyiorum]AZV93816.1 guanosine-3',5'-bis(diphosphate) 3'-pyrophosphohydrolase [Bordetella sp. J329]MCH4273279.1 bifunctional (p)ppGpp synthetase/guanosine-3',5'-bis(diphosphate) 3'-pyrophosphohydrolase [Kerstersia gyiorum]MCI1229600.1 bifunctional (p)ppGpp synthetase/guanosine-3',5'-bis(diphosphate) 3'-pyrophosphohydrolase [Kerstersia gyiorum]